MPITEEDYLVTHQYAAGTYTHWTLEDGEWNYSGSEFLPARDILDLPATVALKALESGGNWSDVYAGIDSLCEASNVKIAETTGWTDIRLDDNHHFDWREAHSFYLT